jgi:hypothetical protein
LIEESIQIRVSLEDVLSYCKGFVTGTAARELCHDLDAGRFLDFFQETSGPQDDRFDLRVVNDGDLALTAQQFYHRPAGHLASFVVVGGDVSNHFDIFDQARYICRKHRYASRICLGDGRADRFGIAWRQYYGVDFAHQEVLYLILLPGRIEVSGGNHDFIAVFRRLSFYRIGHLLEERIGHSQQRYPDDRLDFESRLITAATTCHQTGQKRHHGQIFTHLHRSTPSGLSTIYWVILNDDSRKRNELACN